MTGYKAGERREPYFRRHPAEVTRQRLLTHYEQWFKRLSHQELDAIGKVREALQRIADEDGN